MAVRIVVMGVAGCGKSTLGFHLAQVLRLPFLEGDDFHPEANLQKMRDGMALNDADRDGWLTDLGRQLSDHSAGVVLSCSALKRTYRERLRRAAPDTRFIYLNVCPETAYQRVKQRGSPHPFRVGLVASQFVALEAPDDEPSVIELDGSCELATLVEKTLRWLPMCNDTSIYLLRSQPMDSNL